MKLKNSDYYMLEYCSEKILYAFEKNIRLEDFDIYFENWITATISIMKNNLYFGPKAISLFEYLESAYMYRRNSELGPGFSIGAVYGSLKILNAYRKDY